MAASGWLKAVLHGLNQPYIAIAELPVPFQDLLRQYGTDQRLWVDDAELVDNRCPSDVVLMTLKALWEGYARPERQLKEPPDALAQRWLRTLLVWWHYLGRDLSAPRVDRVAVVRQVSAATQGSGWLAPSPGEETYVSQVQASLRNHAATLLNDRGKVKGSSYAVELHRGLQSWEQALQREWFPSPPEWQGRAGQQRETYQTVSPTLAVQTLSPVAEAEGIPQWLLEQGERLVGRAFMFAHVAGWLQRYTRGYLRIVAAAGWGKTALAMALLRRYAAEGYVFSEALGNTQSAACWRYLTRRLRQRYPLPAAEWLTLDELPAHHQFNALLERIMCHYPAAKIIVVLDALDEAAAPGTGENWLQLFPHLPPGVYIIVTQRPGEYLLQTASDTPVETLPLTLAMPEQYADIAAYLHQHLTENDALRQAWQSTAPALSETAVIAALSAASEGNFMYLTYLLADLAAGRMAFDLRGLPHGLRGYYEHFWQHLARMPQQQQWETWERLYRPALGLLAVAGEPVTPAWLADLLGCTPVEVHERVLIPWQRFLRQVPGESPVRRWAIIHPSFRDFVAEKMELALAHRQVAAYYLAAPHRWAAHADYAGRHLCAHLRQAGMRTALETLLETPAWFRHQAHEGAGLIAYLQDVNHVIALAERAGADDLLALVRWSWWLVECRAYEEKALTPVLLPLVWLGKTAQVWGYIASLPTWAEQATCTRDLIRAAPTVVPATLWLTRLTQARPGMGKTQAEVLGQLALAQAWWKCGDAEQARAIVRQAATAIPTLPPAAQTRLWAEGGAVLASWHDPQAEVWVQRARAGVADIEDPDERLRAYSALIRAWGCLAGPRVPGPKKTPPGALWDCVTDAVLTLKEEPKWPMWIPSVAPEVTALAEAIVSVPWATPQAVAKALPMVLWRARAQLGLVAHKMPEVRLTTGWLQVSIFRFFVRQGRADELPSNRAVVPEVEASILAVEIAAREIAHGDAATARARLAVTPQPVFQAVDNLLGLWREAWAQVALAWAQAGQAQEAWLAMRDAGPVVEKALWKPSVSFLRMLQALVKCAPPEHSAPEEAARVLTDLDAGTWAAQWQTWTMQHRTWKWRHAFWTLTQQLSPDDDRLVLLVQHCLRATRESNPLSLLMTFVILFRVFDVLGITEGLWPYLYQLTQRLPWVIEDEEDQGE